MSHAETALKYTNIIEDIFAQGHVGGVNQRRAKIQVEIMHAIHEAIEQHDQERRQKVDGRYPEE